MNYYGILIAIICFFIIGIFHPIVIKAEYYFTSKCWPVFLLAGLISLIGSVCLKNNIISTILGILGCTCLWSILEIKEQEERVKKGWFPKNPRRM